MLKLDYERHEPDSDLQTLIHLLPALGSVALLTALLWLISTSDLYFRY